MDIQLKSILFLCIIISSIVELGKAQKSDHIWVVGRNSWTGINTNQITFSDTGIASIDTVPHHGTISGANSSYCDPKTGELLLYTDGIHLFNGNYELVENGDSLSPVHWTKLIYEGQEFLGYYIGSNFFNSIVILPIGKDKLGIVHQYGNPGWISDSLFYTEVKIVQKGGEKVKKTNKIEVVKKNIVVSNEIEGYRTTPSAMSAIRHANGRDWWIIIGREGEPNQDGLLYYTFLLDTTGMHFHKTIISLDENAISHDVAMFMANKDGTMLASIDHYSFTGNIGDGNLIVRLYNFNRCSGSMDFYGKVIIDIPAFYYEGRKSGNWFYNGMTFSPGGEYLYINFTTFIIQYPILEEDWQEKGDTIARWSAEIDEEDGVPRISLFANSRLGPDGKVYITAGHDLSKYLHVIHHPNRRGDACDFEQNGIALPYVNKRSIPFYVNYNLGPMDGSPCDTLGLNNYVAAQYRYDIIKPTDGLVYFIDLSDYSPTAWDWDFGDGGTSQEQYPAHTYEEEGIYHVCLVASNMNGSDTICKDILIDDLTSTQAIETLKMAVYPNPVSGGIFTLHNPENIQGEYAISDMSGRVVKTGRITGSPRQQIGLNNSSIGVYVLSIESDNGVYSEKIVVHGE